MRSGRGKVRVDEERLKDLHDQETVVMANPSPEGYMDLANAYMELGLDKESERLIQLAEQWEESQMGGVVAEPQSFLSGAVNSTILIEVMGILSRMKRTGQLVVDAPSQTFRIYFDQGHVINATSLHFGSGMMSFQMALRVHEGMYRFEESRCVKVERLIHENLDMLILEMLHIADEAEAASMNF